MKLCKLCGRKRAERPCPAYREAICSICCGTKRNREIDCPFDCSYLQTAREYQKKKITFGNKHLREHYLDVLHNIEFMILKATDRYRDLKDQNIKEALENLRKTYKTQERGIIYEYKSPDPVIQTVIDNIDSVIKTHLAGGKGLRQINLTEALLCLDEIYNSVRLHIERTSDGKGYLNFIRPFIAKNLITDDTFKLST